jgi:ribose 1,5-bisphosphokinase
MKTQGRLIGVVGPSGVGKDTIMQALSRTYPNLGLVRRVITRSGSAVGEDCEVVSEAEFEARRARGEFAVHWRAHDMHYGVPEDIGDQLAQGRDLLVNLSRSVLLEAQSRFPGFTVLVLTAPKAILRERLMQRGRESLAEIDGRLDRRGFRIPESLDHVVEIANDGDVEDTVQRAYAALYPENEYRAI